MRRRDGEYGDVRGQALSITHRPDMVFSMSHRPRWRQRRWGPVLASGVSSGLRTAEDSREPLASSIQEFIRSCQAVAPPWGDGRGGIRSNSYSLFHRLGLRKRKHPLKKVWLIRAPFEGRPRAFRSYSFLCASVLIVSRRRSPRLCASARDSSVVSPIYFNPSRSYCSSGTCISFMIARRVSTIFVSASVPTRLLSCRRSVTS